MATRNRPLIGGLFLIALGVLFLLNQLFDLPALENLALYFLAGLGLIFLLWGVATRQAGLMIPGGILTGLGLGIALIAGPFEVAPGLDDGGVFMLAFAFGWLLITLFTAVFTDETHWWPLIPAAVMALVAAAVFFGDPFFGILELLGKLWPLALIIGGLAILFGARRKQPKTLPIDEEDLAALDKKTS